MKIAFHTQFVENYGTTDEPRLKFKGGDTYVVENVKDSDLNTEFYDKYTKLLEWGEAVDSNERIINIEKLDDDTRPQMEEWEFPYILDEHKNGWTVHQVREPLEDGYEPWAKDGVVALHKTWEISKEGVQIEGSFKEHLWNDKELTDFKNSQKEDKALHKTRKASIPKI